MALLKRKEKPVADQAPKAKVSPASYDIILAPVVTEKAMKAAESERAVLTFKVATWAEKPSIKRAVEAVFGVKVDAVNTLTNQGKAKRFRGIRGRRSDFKKAVVTLAKGQQLDLTKGAK